ncbi:MAG: UDP-N-acetylmuramate--L-alanine ligase [Desulfobacterota bacterium]|nr:UDP-N-acetylmuramate--L-alanine ligase [Thermodesulfobacteriota bacterium]
MMKSVQKYYFSGIGGSGMSALAHVIKARGNWVGGSDRSFDRKQNLRLFGKLRRQGIQLFSQTTGSLPDVDMLVVSSAIEQDNPEVQQARTRHIPIRHRAELLASQFNEAFGIGIAGTSGKTTVTGMVASVLDAAGKDPTVINGGIIRQYVRYDRIGNAKNGTSNILVSEVDESDGTIVHFHPCIAVITNISKDHKKLEELMTLFRSFADNTQRRLILNACCKNSRALHAPNVVTFGMEDSCDVAPCHISCSAAVSTFSVGDIDFTLRVPGLHNIENALAAIAVGLSLDIPLPVIARGLGRFRGIRRRLERVGSKGGITVIDDFAHNPNKIAASLAALRMLGKRLIVIFQPHGYGPTRFLLRELAEAFSAGMRYRDVLMCLKIYDAGGTADRSISSEDLLAEIKGPRLFSTPERSDALKAVATLAQPGDVIAIMGARDDTLSTFARNVLKNLAV